MTIRARQVTVINQPTLISSTQADRSQGRNDGTILVVNRSATAVYLDGDPDLTSSSGFRIDENESFSATLASDELLYGRTASGSATLHVIEEGI